MKLLKLTKQEESKLQKQFKFGSDLSKQDAIVKIFNPYGRGRWYLLNQDPEDPDYIWAIVDLGMGPEVGSVSFSELQNFRMPVFGYKFPLEKDRFTQRGALEVIEGLRRGKYFADGGEIKVKVAEKDIYTKTHYKGIFQDSDKDGVPDIDDAQPKNPKLAGEVEELKFSQVFNRLIRTKRSLDKIMRAAIAELKKISPVGSTIYARTKTPYSIINKLLNKKATSLERTKLGDVEGLTDLIGTTVVVKSLKDINDVSKELDKGALGEILEKKDYYDKPKAGYRAIHYITIFEGVAVEIQLKTYRQKEINEASHEAYKYENLDAEKLLYLTNLANEADKGDRNAQIKIDKIFLDKKELKESLYKDKIRRNKLPS